MMMEPKKKLLIVDDEESIRNVLERGLKMVGYQVTACEDGAQALNLLDQARFDLMVMDLQMPGMHGTELMRRAREKDRELLIIVLTGTATLESAIGAIRAHAIDFLLKPVGITELIAAVEDALRDHSQDQHRKRVMDLLINLTEPLRPAAPSENGHTPDPTPPPAPVRLDALQRTAYISLRNEIVSLTEGETAILGVFLEVPNQVLACRDLARMAWEYEIEEIEAQTLIRPYIFRLRQKIERDPDQPSHIRTVRGRGYLWDDTI